MNTKIESRPRTFSKRNIALLAKEIQKNQKALREQAQVRYEHRQKNKLLLRLMHLSNGRVPTYMSKYFPIEIIDYENRSAGQWRTIYHRHHVSAEKALRQLRKEACRLGFKAVLDIGKRERGALGNRCVKLTIIGLKGGSL